MDFSEDMKKKLMKLAGISDMRDLEGLMADIAPQPEEGSSGHVEKIKGFIEKHPGVFDKAVVHKVWDLFLEEYPNINSFFETGKDDEDKSISKSLSLKDKGNEAYTKKKLKVAIRHYSEAVEAIPHIEDASEALALALANRSAALYEQGALKKSLRDAEAALYFKFPAFKKFKLHERMAKIYHRQGSEALARSAYEKAVQNIQKYGGTVPESIDNALKSLKSVASVPNISDKDSVADLGNEKFPQLRPGIRVAHDNVKGRHCVSDEEISAGECLLIEEPIVSYLNPKFYNENCPYCFKNLEDFTLPSLNTSKVYCSLRCLEKDSTSIDFWKAASILGEDSTFNIYLALKAIQRHGPHSLEKYLSETNYNWGSDELNFTKYDKEAQYKTIYNLMDHPSDRELEEEARIYARVVLCIRLLRDSGYYKSNPSTESISSNELTVAKCIYRLNSGFKYNLHSINKVSDKTAVVSNKSVPLTDIGSAIFPTLLFMNHSCNPNTYRFNQGKKVLVFAKRKIWPGEEITDCYGIHHFSMPYDERQKNLYKGYRFKCTCEACVYKYPLFHEIINQGSDGIDKKTVMEKISKIKSMSQDRQYQKAAEDSRILLQSLYESDESQIVQPDKLVEHVSLVFCYSQWLQLSQAT